MRGIIKETITKLSEQRCCAAGLFHTAFFLRSNPRMTRICVFCCGARKALCQSIKRKSVSTLML